MWEKIATNNRYGFFNVELVQMHDPYPITIESSLCVIIYFSPLAAFWCQGSSNDSHNLENVSRQWDGELDQT